MKEAYQSSLWMIISAFFYTLQNICVKHLSLEYSIWMILWMRGLVSSIISFFLIWMYSIYPLFGIQKKKLWIRGILGCSNLLFGFYALLYLNVSTVTILQSSSNVWFSILAWIIYRDYWDARNYIGVFFVMIGIYLVFYEHQKDDNFTGILFALISSILNALGNLIMKELKDESTLVVGFYSMILCALCASPMVLNPNKPYLKNTFTDTKSKESIFFLFLTGIFSLIAQNMKNMALQKTPNLGVILLKNLDIVFSSLYDIFVFKDSFTCLEWLGLGLIVCGSVLRKS